VFRVQSSCSNLPRRSKPKERAQKEEKDTEIHTKDKHKEFFLKPKAKALK